MPPLQFSRKVGKRKVNFVYMKKIEFDAEEFELQHAT